MHHFQNKSWGLLWVFVVMVHLLLVIKDKSPLSSYCFIRNQASAIRFDFNYVMKDTISHKYVNWEKASKWMNEEKIRPPLLSGTPGSLRSSFWSPGLGLITALISKLLRAAPHPTGAILTHPHPPTAHNLVRLGGQMRSNWWQFNIIKAGDWGGWCSAESSQNRRGGVGTGGILI